MRWLSLGLAAACCLVLFRIGVMAPRHITLNANEGWNAYHAAGVIAGQPLYPSPPGLFVTNYPPLSFLIVGALGSILGDPMLAGRVLSLCAFVIWTIALRRLGCGWAESAFAAALLAVNILVFVDYYVGVNDPQMLAQAVAAFGPFVLLRQPRTTGRLVAAALLFTAAIFVKHNLIAIPLASVVWLSIVDRGAAVRLTVAGALLGLLGLGACIALLGSGFVQHVTWPRGSTAGKLMTMTRQVVALAVALGSFSLTGVHWNTMFDTAWALALTAALALNRLTRLGGVAAPRLRAGLAAAYLAVPLAVVAAGANVHWGSPRFWLDPRWADVDSANDEVAFLAAHEGRALCENMALCFWAGKPAEADFST